MQIIEVKNNLVRVNYSSNQDNLVLSGFVVIKDEQLSYIAQAMHLEASTKGNFAILKLLFCFDDSGVIKNYDGSIPNVRCPMEIVDTKDLLGLLPVETPIFMGELAQQNTELNLDIKLFEENLLVCCEKLENSNLLTQNIALQLGAQGKKVLIVDTRGSLSQNKITAGQDFKLPLSYETINFIYENGLENAKPESKALVQDVLLEVQNYIKTLPEKFIPFNLFKSVVDDQYKALGIVELVLLKNKLLKYFEEGVFAQEKSEFSILRKSLDENPVTILDVSSMEDAVQKEMISYAYSLTSQKAENTYVIINIRDRNADKKLLKKVFTSQKAFSTVICPHSFKYINELKQISKNLVLFAPLQQQQDFAAYNAFLNKLNPNEFVVYGSSTHHMPLIVELSDKPQNVEQTPPPQSPTYENTYEEPIPQMPAEESFTPLTQQPVVQPEITYEEASEEDIMSAMAELNSAVAQNKAVSPTSAELTEDDLDFIETLDNSDFTNDEIFEPQTTASEEVPEILTSPAILYSQNQSVEPDGFLLNEEEAQSVPTQSDTLPVYPADIEPQVETSPDSFNQGDTVTHIKYGRGVIEKMINYGNKTLCSIQFDNVGRRLLDPTLSELTKV